MHGKVFRAHIEKVQAGKSGLHLRFAWGLFFLCRDPGDDRAAVGVQKRGHAAAVAGGDLKVVDAGLPVDEDRALPAEGAALVQNLDEAFALLCHVTSPP